MEVGELEGGDGMEWWSWWVGLGVVESPQNREYLDNYVYPMICPLMLHLHTRTII